MKLIIIALSVILSPSIDAAGNFSSFVSEMNIAVERANPKKQRRVVLIGVDGLQSDWLVHQIKDYPEHYPALGKFLNNGTWVKNFVPPLPSLSVTGWLSIVGGQSPGGPFGHKISAFHWVNREEGWYRDLISIQFFQKDADYLENGGESLFSDYPDQRTAAYGFYLSEGADDAFAVEFHGGLEIGLGIRPEPLEIENWKERKGGAQYDLGLYSDRLTHIREEIRLVNEELENIEKGTTRHFELLNRSDELKDLEIEYSALLEETKRKVDFNWNTLNILLNEANRLVEMKGCDGENFIDTKIDGNRRVPVYEFLKPSLDRVNKMIFHLDALIDSELFFDKRAILIGDKIQSIESLKNRIISFGVSFQKEDYSLATWWRILRQFHEIMLINCALFDGRKYETRFEITKLLKLVKSAMFPIVTTFSSYTFDWLLHREGLYSDANINEIRNHVEPYVEDIFRTIEYMHFDGPTYFILLSDHGSSSTQNLFFLSDILEERFGLKIKRLSTLEGESITVDPFPNSFDVFGYDALVASTGGGYISLDMSILEKSYSSIGFPNMNEWARHPLYKELKSFLLQDGRRIDLIDILKNKIQDFPNITKNGKSTFQKNFFAKEENVLDFFIVREDYSTSTSADIRIVGPRGEGLLRRKGAGITDSLYSYAIVEGDDPLQLQNYFITSSLVGENKWWSDSVWKDATVQTPRKDIINRLAHLFDFDRSGTVIFFIKDNWSGNALVHGRHGGALMSELKATLAILGPDIPAGGKILTARVEDVRRLIADLIGVTPITSTDLLEREALLPKILNAQIEAYEPEVPWGG